MTRPFYTLAVSDVGKLRLRVFGQEWPMSSFIGRVLPSDVGKRVYLMGDVLQVENNEQCAKREKE